MASARINRRHFLQSAALASSASLVSGCSLFRHNKQVLRTGRLVTPGIDPTQSPLTIDTHCHIFNGSDLQVKEFVSRVVITEKGILQAVAGAVGRLLEILVWDNAPSGEKEIAILERLGAMTSDTRFKALAHTTQKRQYTHARNAVLRTRSQISLAPTHDLAPQRHLSQPMHQALSGMSPELANVVVDPSEDNVLRQIYAGFEPGNYQKHVELYHKNVTDLQRFTALLKGQLITDASVSLALTGSATALTVAGVIRYLSENFQYRIVEAQDYLDTFTRSSRRSIDLMLADLVDYDWPLAQGKATPTTLQSQIETMKQISILTHGQIHAFAPYDPMREVAFKAGQRHEKTPSYSSLTLVQKAILEDGCIGVKLYPTMGFGASCNASKSNEFWAGKGLQPWMSENVSYNDGKPALSFGARLDAALDELFCWCCENGVPVMAHSDQTNGVDPDFRELASARYWAPVCIKYPQLRISFGHLGDFSGPSKDRGVPQTAQDFIKLFTEANRAYGDSAYDSEILRDAAGTTERFQDAYQHNELLPRRMMYGTDWNLLMTQGNIDAYMQLFQTLAAKLPPGNSKLSIQDRFFGWNAVDFLGLRPNDQARKRLDAFYTTNHFDLLKSPPVWMAKVDRE